MGEPLVNRGSDMFELEILLSRKEASSLAVWIDAYSGLFCILKKSADTCVSSHCLIRSECLPTWWFSKICFRQAGRHS